MPDSVSIQSPVLSVAHLHGNDRGLLERALATKVDFVEADVWSHPQQGMVCRHERRLGVLPLLFDKWYLKLDIGPVRFDGLLDAVRGKTRMYADLKDGHPEFIEAVVKCLKDAGELETSLLSGHYWFELAMARRRWGIPVYPSVPDEASLGRFLRFLDAGNYEVDGVAIRHWLLNHEVSQLLRERGLGMIAWTVDDTDRAHDLAGLGVQAIVSNMLPLLSGLRNGNGVVRAD